MTARMCILLGSLTVLVNSGCVESRFWTHPDGREPADVWRDTYECDRQARLSNDDGYVMAAPPPPWAQQPNSGSRCSISS
jgi:hypothetical protein